MAISPNETLRESQLHSGLGGRSIRLRLLDDFAAEGCCYCQTVANELVIGVRLEASRRLHLLTAVLMHFASLICLLL